MSNKVTVASRFLLGLGFTIFGLDGLIRFTIGRGIFPEPANLSPQMIAVMGGLMGMKYLIPLAKALEFISGILFITNRYVNLGIILLTPVMINILGINLFVDQSGSTIAIALFVLLIIVIRSRWNYFKSVVFVK